ncbi:hypothetical protein RYU24_03890 [Acinetobacter variabilis]|nr:hypothetical protein RYU24_03890 [Acinetobacter variabilis]
MKSWREPCTTQQEVGRLAWEKLLIPEGYNQDTEESGSISNWLIFDE